MKLWMKTRRVLLFFVLFSLVAGFGIAAIEDDGSQQVYSVLEKAFYLSGDDAVWIRPGLHVQIISVQIPSNRQPLVTFRLTDDGGQGLDRLGSLTPGTVGLGIILAYLPNVQAGSGQSQQYVSYSTTTQKSPITGVTAVQAATDSGGTYTSRGDGTYDYQFKTVLPANFDQTVTHTLGIYASRDLSAFGLSRYVDNQIYNFVPNGTKVTAIRQVAVTASCNQCHDPLMAHGTTGRQSVEICILCHTPQTTDPDTGNTVDMKVMIHKIHDGASLPSVIAGKPYQIIGYQQSVQDYSTVVFPQDIRNCKTCHNAPPGSTSAQQPAQMNNWYLVANRDACGSCHDDINFATGAGHAGNYPQKDDKSCTMCHQPQSDTEWDASIINAHIVPFKSNQLRNGIISILSVTNTAPGQKPVVKFKVTDKNGANMDPKYITRLSLNLAGPNTDVRWQVTETATSATFNPADGTAVYTCTNAIPATATGSYSVEMEGYLTTNINGPLGKPLAQRDPFNNIVVPFAVTDKTPVARRQVVETARCANCHDTLWFHGGTRNDVKACVICHNPTRTAGTPGQSISFQVMIHRIHTGENLVTNYTIGSTNFNDIRFSGDLRDCLECHDAGTYTVPLPATNTSVSWPAGYWDPMRPTAAACLGCHDTVDAAAHAIINTASFAESCSVCHKESADFAVSLVHAR
jgi:OmcA/MtrC family decaheme c-type cytochrome